MSRLYRIEEGVADEGRVDTVLLIELFLEFKEDDDLFNVAPYESDAVRAPCPDLRAYVIDDGNIPLMQLRGQMEVETGVVNEYREVGVRGIYPLDQFLMGRADL